MSPKRVSLTSEQVLDQIRNRHRQERSLKSSRVSLRLRWAACKRFGSWPEAIAAAGFDYRTVVGRNPSSVWRKLSSAELLKTIRGRSRKGLTLKSSLLPSNLPYYARVHFGGWPAALKAAGLDQLKSTGRQGWGHWGKAENRRRAIRELASNVAHPLNRLSVSDFYRAGLRSVLHYHQSSPDQALVFAGVIPFLGANGFWSGEAIKSKRNRILAVRQVVRCRIKLHGTVKGIGVKDFRDAGQEQLLDRGYGGSPRRALLEAGFDLQPWEFDRVSRLYWKKRSHRREALRWLMKRSRKSFDTIGSEDARASNLAGVLAEYYGSSIWRWIKDCFPDEHARLTRKRPMGWWSDVQNRASAIKDIVKSLPLRSWAQVDLVDLPEGLVDYYRREVSGDPWTVAMKEAGFPAKEQWMARLNKCTKTKGALRGTLHRSKLETHVADDLWHLGLKDWNTDHPYLARWRGYTCDFVSPDRTLWVEVAGMSGREYQANLMRKAAVARRRGHRWIQLTVDDIMNNRRHPKRLSKVYSRIATAYYGRPTVIGVDQLADAIRKRQTPREMLTRGAKFGEVSRRRSRVAK